MDTTTVLPPAALDVLIGNLRDAGCRVIGPTRRDGAIVYDDVDRVADLPRGWTDAQAPGRYRLQRRDDDALFGYAVGPDSWKRHLFPPRHRLWSTVAEGDTHFRVVEPPQPAERMAFLGVRGCELAAIAVQDRVFLGGLAADPVYAARRDDVVLVAVSCAAPADTCFCTSMGTGPQVTGGADLVITELLDDDGHELAVRACTDLGRALLAGMGEGRPADDAVQARIDAQAVAAAARITRRMDAEGVVGLLRDNLEHPRWAALGDRCLSCASCTMVCPTCICAQVEDVTDLDGGQAHHDRRWDSCFTTAFSRMAHGTVRQSSASRHRQWMTHKLSTWVDQFGTSGCVGCGRCIAWCPVGIDITAEATAFAMEAIDDGPPAAPPPAAPPPAAPPLAAPPPAGPPAAPEEAMP